MTGATGMVGGPLAQALAADNTVFGGARFSNPEACAELEAAGATAVRVDLGAADFDEVPDDLDYVLNFAVARSNDWEADFAANVEGPALLMERCVGIDTFFQCSTAGVYESQGQTPLSESAPLGDSHRVGRLPDVFDQQDRGGVARAAHRVAAEHAHRDRAAERPVRRHVRMADVPGDDGGARHPDRRAPRRTVPLRAAASRRHRGLAPLPARGGVGAGHGRELGGDENVAVEEWCALIGDLVGKEPVMQVDPNAIPSLPLDVTRLNDLGFHSTVSWQDGIRRLVDTRRAAAS